MYVNSFCDCSEITPVPTLKTPVNVWFTEYLLTVGGGVVIEFTFVAITPVGFEEIFGEGVTKSCDIT